MKSAATIMRQGLFDVAMVLAFWLVATAALAQIPIAAAQWQKELTKHAQAEYGINAPIANFAAQIHQESGWRANARSPVGALGMTQFMPATANWISKLFPSELGDNDPSNPEWSIRALVKYNKFLENRVRHATDKCERLAFAMAGYNGGEGWVRKRQALSPAPAICFGVTCLINPGIKPSNQKENAHYTTRILHEVTPRYVKAGWGLSAC